MNSSTVPQARISTLANILAACTRGLTASFSNCTTLLDNAVTMSGTAAKTTCRPRSTSLRIPLHT